MVNIFSRTDEIKSWYESARLLRGVWWHYCNHDSDAFCSALKCNAGNSAKCRERVKEHPAAVLLSWLSSSLWVQLACTPERCALLLCAACNTVAIWVQTSDQRHTEVCATFSARNNTNKTFHSGHSLSEMDFLCVLISGTHGDEEGEGTEESRGRTLPFGLSRWQTDEEHGFGELPQ